MPTPTPPAPVPDSTRPSDSTGRTDSTDSTHPTGAAAPPGADRHGDPDLAVAQRHLADSRTALARMRDRTAGLDSSAAGDWVSQKFLESAIYLRMKALADDPTVPLFFGRLDYDEAHEDASGSADGSGSSTAR